jgi:hypothetical protein
VIKVSALLNFLISKGNIKEYDYLYKLANGETPEDFLKTNYPKVFTIFERDSKPAGAFINILNRMSEEQKDRITESMTFSQIVEIMKEKKEDEKREEKESIFSGFNLSDENISKLERIGATKDEVAFIVNEETRGAHLLEEAIGDLGAIKSIVNYLLSSRVDLEKTSVAEFSNMDEAMQFFQDKKFDHDNAKSETSKAKTLEKLDRYYRYIYNGDVDEGHDYKGYEGVEPGIAKRTSKIIHSNDNITIVMSLSKEACQYWERGAVNVDEKGRARFSTCTSRIEKPEGFDRENLYSSYEDYAIFQVLKGVSSEEPKYRFEMDSSKDMVTLCYDAVKSEFLWGGSTTVDADDNDISKDAFVSNYGEYSHEILELIKRYVQSNIDEIVVLSHAMFFNLEMYKEDRFSSVKTEILKMCSPKYLYGKKELLVEWVRLNEGSIVEKMKDLSANNLTKVLGAMDDPEFSIFFHEHAKYGNEALENIINKLSENMNTTIISKIYTKITDTLENGEYFEGLDAELLADKIKDSVVGVFKNLEHKHIRVTGQEILKELTLLDRSMFHSVKGNLFEVIRKLPPDKFFEDYNLGEIMSELPQRSQDSFINYIESDSRSNFKIDRRYGDYSVGVFSIPDFRDIIKEKMSELVYCNLSNDYNDFNTEYQDTSRLDCLKNLADEYSDQASSGASGEMVGSILELMFSKENLEDSLDEFSINISRLNILDYKNQLLRYKGSYFYDKCIRAMNSENRSLFLQHIDVPFDDSLEGLDIMEVLDKQFLFQDQTHEGLSNFFMNFKGIESLLTNEYMNLYEDDGINDVITIVTRTARNMYNNTYDDPNHSHYFSKYGSPILNREILNWKNNFDSKRIMKKAIRITLEHLNIPRSKW